MEINPSVNCGVLNTRVLIVNDSYIHENVFKGISTWKFDVLYKSSEVIENCNNTLLNASFEINKKESQRNDRFNLSHLMEINKGSIPFETKLLTHVNKETTLFSISENGLYLVTIPYHLTIFPTHKCNISENYMYGDGINAAAAETVSFRNGFTYNVSLIEMIIDDNNDIIVETTLLSNEHHCLDVHRCCFATSQLSGTVNLKNNVNIQNKSHSCYYCVRIKNYFDFKTDDFFIFDSSIKTSAILCRIL